MNLSGVFLGYFDDFGFSFIREIGKPPNHPKQVLYQAEPRADLIYLPVITNININKCKTFIWPISAHICSKMHPKEGDHWGKNGVFRPVLTPAYLRTLSGVLIDHSSKLHQNLNNNFRFHLRGGSMGTTQHMIRQTKKELQKLRAEFLQAVDQAEREIIKRRIEYHKRVLAYLGGGE